MNGRICNAGRGETIRAGPLVLSAAAELCGEKKKIGAVLICAAAEKGNCG